MDYKLWFYKLKIPCVKKFELINQFFAAKNVWEERKNINISSKINSELNKEWDYEEINCLKNLLKCNNMCYITMEDEDYPRNLKNYENSPYLLFYKGDIKGINTNYNISIVGSRKCSSYGINATRSIGKEISRNKINIISGMALGIDKCAHEAALMNSGFTCAVLGSGVDVIYPYQNKKLYEEIVERGCVISEFYPGTKPFPSNFPVRNRIISGISDLLIVIEAGIRSGTLITVDWALNQGKDIYVVPGSIFSAQSAGTNNLIFDGASPLVSTEEMLSHLGVREKNNKDSLINPEIEKILELISDNPIHIDDIIKYTKVDIKRIYAVLFEMQVKKEIMCLSGNYYVRSNANQA